MAVNIFNSNNIIFEPDPSLHKKTGFLSNDIHKIRDNVNNTRIDLRRTVFVETDSRGNHRFVDSSGNYYALFYYDEKWEYKTAFLRGDQVIKKIGPEMNYSEDFFVIKNIEEIDKTKVDLLRRK